MFVLTLEGERISAITWFGDSGVFPQFGLRRCCGGGESRILEPEERPDRLVAQGESPTTASGVATRKLRLSSR